MLVLETLPRVHGIFIFSSNNILFLEFLQDLSHMLHLSWHRHLLPFSMFVIFLSSLLLLLVQLMRMVTFHVSFKIGVLSESLSAFRARESVFVLVREMNHLGGEINYTYQNYHCYIRVDLGLPCDSVLFSIPHVSLKCLSS